MKHNFQNDLERTTIHVEFCEAENYLYAEFVGLQSLPVLVEACETALKILQEKACTKILSNNSRMIGGKDFAYDYILTTFAPQAIANGLKYFAYVMPSSPGNPQSVRKLEVTFPPEIEFMLFDTVEDARRWLLSK